MSTLYQRLSGIVIITVVWGYLIYLFSAVHRYLTRSGQSPLPMNEYTGSETGQFNSELYYIMLGPVLIPVVVVAGYLNWLGFKFFSHN